MVAALSVLLVLGLAVAAAWQLREMGGSVEIAVGELFLAIDLPALLVVLALLFGLLHGLLSGLRALAGWPARRRAPARPRWLVAFLPKSWKRRSDRANQ
jgi:HemY protein